MLSIFIFIKIVGKLAFIELKRFLLKSRVSKRIYCRTAGTEVGFRGTIFKTKETEYQAVLCSQKLDEG